MTTPNDRQRLARLMDERRQDLRLTWDVVAQAAGLSREGLRRVREGHRAMRALTQRGIEDALKWEPGSVLDILAGGEPTPVAEGRTQQEREARSAALDREMNEERERLRELTEKLENGDLPLAAAYLQGLIDRSAG